MIAALGPYRFDITGIPAHQVGEDSGSRLKAHQVHGKAPLLERLGPDTTTVTINAVLYPLEPFHQNGPSQLSALMAAAKEGRSEMMVLGSGAVIGRMAIERVRKTDTHHQPGGAPARVGISITLKSDDETSGAGLGALLTLF